jgi:hypothetical protein
MHLHMFKKKQGKYQYQTNIVFKLTLQKILFHIPLLTKHAWVKLSNPGSHERLNPSVNVCTIKLRNDWCSK